MKKARRHEHVSIPLCSRSVLCDVTVWLLFYGACRVLRKTTRPDRRARATPFVSVLFFFFAIRLPSAVHVPQDVRVVQPAALLTRPAATYSPFSRAPDCAKNATAPALCGMAQVAVNLNGVWIRCWSATACVGHSIDQLAPPC
jgi:hypothetical protein